MPNQNQSDPNQNQQQVPDGGVFFPPQPDIPPLPPEFQKIESSNSGPADDVSDKNPGDSGSGAPTPPAFSGVTTSPKKKFGGGKIIATILGVFMLIGGIGAGIFLMQRQQLFEQKALVTEPTDQPSQTSTPSTTYAHTGNINHDFPGNVCSVAYIHASSRISGGAAGYISIKVAEEAAQKAGASFKVFDLSPGKQTLKAGDLDGIDMIVVGDLEVRDSSAPTRTLTNEELDVIKNRYLQGAHVIAGGDNGRPAGTSTVLPREASKTVRQVVDYIQGTTKNIRYRDIASTVVERDGVTSSSYTAFNGLYYDTRTDSFYTPGIVLITSPAVCIREIGMADGTGDPTCILSILPSRNGRGVLVVDANAGKMATDGLKKGMWIKNSGCQQPTAPPTSTPTTTPTISPTETPPDSTYQCVSIKVYDMSWNLLSSQDLQELKPGDKIRFGAVFATDGTVDKARFTINGTLRPEVTTLKPGTSNEIYDEYTIPEGITTFKVTSQIHSTEIGWF